MKRFVYVPNNLMGTDSKIPNEALEMSKKNHLQIRIGEQDDGFDLSKIDIITIPERAVLDYSKTVEKNFIQSIDYTNEFVSFNKNFYCKVTNQENKELVINPRLTEKHCIKFRFRLSTLGLHYFDIMDERNSPIVEQEIFEVV
jgi:hypothetical protein